MKFVFVSPMNREERIAKSIDSYDEFYDTIFETEEMLLKDKYLKSKVESILNHFTIGKIRGICIKSFPLPPDLMYYVNLIHLC